REDAVRLGPKRPPVAIGLRADGTGVARVVATPGIADVLARWPGLDVEEVEVAGPPTSVALRAAGWAEVAVMQAVLAAPGPDAPITVVHPDGGRATVRLDDGAVHVAVDAGAPLDPVVLRSYVIGAVHQAIGWVTSEGLAVDDAGQVHSLTIRSFGI